MSADIRVLIKEPDFRRMASRAFAKGLVFVTIFFGLLFAWMIIRADDTLHRWQSAFPSKTVIIETYSGRDEGLPSIGLGQSDLITPQENEQGAAARLAARETPFNRFKKSLPLTAGHGKLAIVLFDLGVSENFTKTVIETLPPAVTLGFSPYADKLDVLQAGASSKGFEIWLTLPLEPAQYPEHDPGPLTVMSNASLDAIHDHVTRLSARAAQGYPGFISNADHTFSDIDLRTNPLMRMIAERGFGFAEGRPGNAFAKEYAAQTYIPYAQADEWLRRNMGRTTIQTILQRTEKQAQLNGSAVLMVEATPLSLQMIQEWAEKLPGRNIQIVPLSMLAQ